MKETVDKVKEDIALRPLFLDFIGKNIVLGMTESFTVDSVNRARIQKEFYDSLFRLSEQLQKNVAGESLEPIIEQVCLYYMGKIGRVSFDRYQ